MAFPLARCVVETSVVNDREGIRVNKSKSQTCGREKAGIGQDRGSGPKSGAFQS
jgi:hypothetical protein